MKIRKPGKKLFILMVFLFLPVFVLSANPFNWAAHASIFYFAADNGQDSDPAPILPSMGFSGAWHFWGPFRLELSTDIYFTNYEFRFTDFENRLGYAMACNPENRSAFVLGLLTGLQLTGFIPINNNGAGVRIYGGPAVDLRIVTLAFGLNHPSDLT